MKVKCISLPTTKMLDLDAETFAYTFKVGVTYTLNAKHNNPLTDYLIKNYCTHRTVGICGSCESCLGGNVPTYYIKDRFIPQSMFVLAIPTVKDALRYIRGLT